MTIEVTAKKPEDAIKQGLEQLGATLDDVEVEVLESGGLFRKAKVRLTIERDEPTSAERAPQDKADNSQKPQKAQTQSAESGEKAQTQKVEKAQTQSAESGEKVQKPQKAQKVQKPEKAEKSEKTEKTEKTEKVKAAEKEDKQAKTDKAEKGGAKRIREDEAAALAHACEFVKNVVAKMGIEADVALNNDNGMIEINAPAGDDALIIGRHGETLSALSYIAETAERAEKSRVGVAVDCNGYRARRAASLSAMARRRADECVKKNRRIKLESMERADRRTIHFALADDDRVTTASEGKEPHRYIVISPKK